MIRRSTWITLGIFAVLLVAFLVLQQTGTDAPADAALPTTAVQPNLFSFSLDEIVGVRVENLDGQAVEFERSGEVWQLVQPEAAAEQVDQSRIDGLLAQLTGIRMLIDADINASLSALRLEFPPHRLIVTLASGDQAVLAIGDTSVTNTGYYVSLNGGGPRLVPKTALDALIGLLDAPPLLPTPVPTPAGAESGAPEASP